MDIVLKQFKIIDSVNQIAQINIDGFIFVNVKAIEKKILGFTSDIEIKYKVVFNTFNIQMLSVNKIKLKGIDSIYQFKNPNNFNSLVTSTINNYLEYYQVFPVQHDYEAGDMCKATEVNALEEGYLIKCRSDKTQMLFLE